jgi:protein O-mannosyl-transferase
MTSDHTSRSTLVYSLALLALCLLTFARAVTFEFLSFDDLGYLVKNPHLRFGLTWEGVKWAFAFPTIAREAVSSPFWRPVTYLSHLFDFELFGTRPAGHHATNILLHALNSVGLFVVLKYLTGKVGRSFCVAAFFLLHPFQVETVAWVSARNNLVSAFWLFALLGTHALYVKRKSAVSHNLTTIFFALCLLSKSAMVAAPFLLLMIDYWPLERTKLKLSGWKALVIEKWPLFLLSVSSAVTTLYVRPPILKESTSILQMAQHSAVAFGFYLKKTFLPVELTIYDTWANAQPAPWVIPVCGVAVIVISVLVVRAAERKPYLAMGWFWWLFAILPAAALPEPADRYMYVPIVGIALAATWCAAETFLKSRQTLARILFLVCVFALALSSIKQVSYWKNDFTFFRRILALNPNHYFGNIQLGNAYAREGQVANAMTHYEAANKIAPSRTEPHFNIATLLAAQGDFGLARKGLGRALEIEPNNGAIYEQLGMVYQQEERFAEAAATYQKAVMLQPGAWRAHQNLAVLLDMAGKRSVAIAHQKESLKHNPNNPRSLIHLGQMFTAEGALEKAVQSYEMALKIERKPTELRRSAETALREAKRILTQGQ